MARKVGKAILPGHRSDPTNTDRLERGAFNRFAVVMRAATRAYREALEKIPVRAITANKRYEFRLDEGLLRELLSGAGLQLDGMLFDGYQSTWLFDDYVRKAAERGATQSRANIAQQVRIPLKELADTDPYRLRMGLLQVREFEEMAGLSGTVKADMSRILTDGIGRGLNPLEVARNLSAQTNINIRRAERIARTEIPNALRRARMEEDQELMDTYGFKTMQMHFSALSPTTRESHAARHGNLYTIEQQQEWWSRDANSISCKCVTIGVLVDDAGNPIDPNIQKQARQIKKTVEARRK